MSTVVGQRVVSSDRAVVEPVVQAKASDAWLFGLSLAASVVGLFAIWNAGYTRAAASGQILPRELVVQAISLAIGLAGYWAATRLKDVRKFAWPFWWACTFALAAVLVPGIGEEINGARRWIDFGLLSVQPAEFAKLAVIGVLAAVLAGRKPPPKPKRRPRHWAEALDWVWVPRIKRAWILIPVAVSAVLIELEPDLATAMVVATTAFVMLWLGGVRTGSLIGLVVATGLVVGALVLKEPYRMERILHHGDRWEAGLVDSIGYQTTQSEAAMARGGPLGVGFTQGQAKHTLPAPTTDFVMTTVAEETGLVGSLAVFAMIGGVVWRLLALVRATTDRFGRLVLGGTATWLTVQACTNLVMANGTLPPIGVPMPFLSYGGSSLLALWLALGVCQAVAGAAAKEGSADEAGGDRRRYGRSRLSRA